MKEWRRQGKHGGFGWEGPIEEDSECSLLINGRYVGSRYIKNFNQTVPIEDT
jgi:hypothetical protein